MKQIEVVNFGTSAEDLVTGVKGVVTGYAYYYWTESPAYRLEYKGDDGSLIETWIVAQRLVFHDSIEETDNKNKIETSLPVGFEIREESKNERRSFAIKPSILREFKRIAEEKDTNINALFNEILELYVAKEANNGR